MIQDPFYQIISLMRSGQTADGLTLGFLADADRKKFLVDGRKQTITGRAEGLTLSQSDEGECFLCLCSGKALYALCKLKEE